MKALEEYQDARVKLIKGIRKLNNQFGEDKEYKRRKEQLLYFLNRFDEEVKRLMEKNTRWK